MTDEIRNEPHDLATEATDAGIEAVAAYLREHGHDADEILVLVTVKGGGAATAMSGSMPGPAVGDVHALQGARVASALLTHFKLTMDALGAPVSVKAIREMLRRA